jgi:triosephosphate isomerase
VTDTPLIAGNWKMNTTLPEALDLAARVAVGAPAEVEVVVCPPFPWLLPVRDEIAASSVELGAQDCWTEPAGAFTGEVSPAMLAEICRYVIVGHSERRRVIGETDALIAAKLRAALDQRLSPILCVGEDLEERKAGAARDVVAGQLNAALVDLTPDKVRRLTIAYEPVWAIGTGISAQPSDAAEMAGAIRSFLWERDAAAADVVRVLYGGSVTAETAPALLAAADVDGALVGGASLKADAFLAIARAAVR